jgi:nucleotide-binding universal stress UspA family protein
MNQFFAGYERILAATDLSQDAAAVWKAHWAAKHNHCPLVVAHVERDLLQTISQTCYRSRAESVEKLEERFHGEQQRRSDSRLMAVIAGLPSADIKITYETLLGETYAELINAVKKERFGLVVCGARSGRDWAHKILGSTARRLIQSCPSSVWVVKRALCGPPKTVLAAVDFSESSRWALGEAMLLARHADAVLHVLHVIEATDIPNELLDLKPSQGPHRSLRELIQDEGQRRFDNFLADAQGCGISIKRHLLWGRAWERVVDLSWQLKADLVAIGTVGRMEVEEALLGNTAGNVLRYCDCDLLTVKPARHLSPVHATVSPLPPAVETANDSGISAAATLS